MLARYFVLRWLSAEDEQLVAEIALGRNSLYFIEKTKGAGKLFPQLL